MWPRQERRRSTPPILSGTAAIYDGNPLQRHLRDSAVVTQHAFLGDGMYDGTGSVLMGQPPLIPGFI